MPLCRSLPRGSAGVRSTTIASSAKSLAPRPGLSSAHICWLLDSHMRFVHPASARTSCELLLSTTTARRRQLTKVLRQREEIRLALALGTPTSMYDCIQQQRSDRSIGRQADRIRYPRSPCEYHLLFGVERLPTTPTVPNDIAFVFSMSPEPPEVRKLAFDFQDHWILFPFPIYHHLEHVLAYAPKKRLLTSVQYSWSKLDEITSHIGTAVDKILNDPRFRTENVKPRPKSCLSKLFHVEVDSLYVLKSCHNALIRSGAADGFFHRSQQLWFTVLTRSARRLELLPVRDIVNSP